MEAGRAVASIWAVVDRKSCMGQGKKSTSTLVDQSDMRADTRRIEAGANAPGVQVPVAKPTERSGRHTSAIR